jgi:hypothetical protein
MPDPRAPNPSSGLPTTPPRPSRWPIRRLALLLATALPILLLATAGCYILIRYLTARDALGAYTLTVHDQHGAVVGHGRLELVATAWTTDWSWHPPYVTFTPTLRPDAGTLAVTDWSFWDTAEPSHPNLGPTRGSSFTLRDLYVFNDQSVVVLMDAHPGLTPYFCLPIDQDQPNCPWMYTIGDSYQGTVPCTIAVKRDRP